MPYEQLIQKDIPYIYYNLDNAGTNRPPLVWSGLGSSLISSNVEYTFPVFTNKQQTYALEIWCKPIDGNVSILGHAENDGLKWIDNYLIYEMWIGDKKIKVFSYQKIPAIFHVVIVYDITSLMLYINGELKDSYIFNEEEKQLPYHGFSNPDKLTTPAGFLVVDAVAFYSQLSADVIKNHYLLAQPQTYIMRNAAIQSAETFEFHIDNIYHKEVIPDLNQAEFNNVSLNPDGLTQNIEDGQILAGSWTTLVNTQNIQNTIVEYESNNPVGLKYSYDGTTWTTFTDYVNTPTQSYFLLKIEFGTTKTVVSSIKIYQYENQTIYSYGGMRSLEIKNRPVLTDYFYPTIAKDKGVTGQLTINGTEPANSVEMWIKSSSSNDITSLSGTKTINNGAGWFNNEWNHVVINGSVPNTFTVGNAGTKIATLNVYVNQPDIPTLYKSYFGQNKISFDETSVVSIEDSFKDYSYKWSVIIG